MTSISDIAPLSEEAQKGEVFGIVRLYNVNNPSKPEASADVLLSPTPKTLFQPLVLTCLMVVFSSWRKPSFPGPKTLFISSGGIGFKYPYTIIEGGPNKWRNSI